MDDIKETKRDTFLNVWLDMYNNIFSFNVVNIFVFVSWYMNKNYVVFFIFALLSAHKILQKQKAGDLKKN